MTREEIIDFCEMKSQLEPENEDIFNHIIKTLEARDKMIEDIENINDTVHDGTNHFYKTAEDIKTEVIDIINEHLGEIEE